MKEQTNIRKKGKAQNAADYLPSDNLSLNTYCFFLEKQAQTERQERDHSSGVILKGQNDVSVTATTYGISI